MAITFRAIPRSDGTLVHVPLMPLSKDPSPEPFVASCCGQTITGEWHTCLRSIRIWHWAYCDCMNDALQLEAQERKAQEAEDARIMAHRQFVQRQHEWDHVFPQWRDSKKVPRQTLQHFRPHSGNQRTWTNVRRWMATDAPDRQGFTLTGPVGTGKTHLVRAVGHAYLAQDQHVLYTTVPFLLERLRDQLRDAPTMDQVLRLHTRAALVIWDDLGAEKPTEWTLDRLFLLVDALYEAEIPLLVTTNWAMSALEERVGARIVSRLVEMGPIWSVQGDDHRIVQAVARQQVSS